VKLSILCSSDVCICLQVKTENGYLTAHVDMLRQQHQQNNHVLNTPLTALVTTKCNSPSQMSTSDSASNTRVATRRCINSCCLQSQEDQLRYPNETSSFHRTANILTRPVAAANAHPACSVQTNGWGPSEQTVQTVTSSIAASASYHCSWHKVMAIILHVQCRHQSDTVPKYARPVQTIVKDSKPSKIPQNQPG